MMRVKNVTRLIGILFCVFVLIVIGLTVGDRYVTYGSILPTTCTLGITATAANMTLSGMGASKICQYTVSESKGYTYLVTQEPQGTELCEGDTTAFSPMVDSNTTTTIHYVIRDTGLLDTIGSQECSAMEKMQTH